MSSFDENLILEVCKHKLIYNAKSPAYSNRHKRYGMARHCQKCKVSYRYLL